MRKLLTSLSISRWVCAALLPACLLVPSLPAQFDAATVLGYVRDKSGAALPNSHVVLKNTQTGVTRSLQADSEGRYQFLSVPVGLYVVESDAPGFDRSATAPFQLTVNAQQRVNRHGMQLGA